METQLKSTTNLHREYLDALSDDESGVKVGHVDKDKDEEKEEPEEESEHVYEIDELEKLVNYTKEMTTLGDIKNDDWTDECCETIRSFFCHAKYRTLSIFISNGNLKCILDFPTYPVRIFTYFVKDGKDTFTIENFHDKIICGTNNDYIEGNLLSLMEEIFYPILSKEKSWPDKTKADFLDSMQDNMCKITDLRYKMLGLTVIYQPPDVNGLTLEEATADKELIKRLDETVLYWLKQIQDALDDREQTSFNELLCLMDEYKFWVHRQNNLRNINEQLQSPSVQHIVRILVNTQSTNVAKLTSLTGEIRQNIKESEHNIDFLTLLKKPCNELDACANPQDIVHCLPKLFHTLRIVWINNPFLGNARKMSELFMMVSHQIIILCRNMCKLNTMDKDRTETDIQTLKSCIEVCSQFEHMFLNVGIAGRKLSVASMTNVNFHADLNTDKIFWSMDKFIEECQEILKKLEK